jgi:aminoglycoside phosphotransferase (APT) family kinase protein
MTFESSPTDVMDEGRATGWITSAIPELIAPLQFELVPAGRSNLTFLITDDSGERIALRRPPGGHLAPTAHDMEREYAVITALDGTELPVPKPLAFCSDASLIGTPFYVMSFVDGLVLREESDCAGLEDSVFQSATGDLVDVLARLHLLDIEAIGLGDLGRRGGYVERQLRRWDKQYEAAAGGVEIEQLVRRVHNELVKVVPQSQTTSLVHGDYRLDNVILSPTGRVRAVLDWELCAIGDPLADLGLLLTYWSSKDRSQTPVPTATGLPGFPSRAALVEGYANASGLDVSDISYYVALAHWKVLCILDGVYGRYRDGGGGGSQDGVDHYPELIAGLAEKAHRILSGHMDGVSGD